MMSKERELLKRWLCITPLIIDPMYEKLNKKTQELLAELMESEEKVSKLLDKPEQEPLSEEAVGEYLGKQIFQHFSWDSGFKFGVKYAEKEHGIGE